MSLEIVQESIKEHKPALLDKKNVVCVSSGFKVKNGVTTDIPSYIVGVVSKKDPNLLSSDEIIPSEINGIKTDVIEIGEISALGTCVTDVVTGGAACSPHGSLYDPLQGGISIGCEILDRTQSWVIRPTGTLGSICVDVADGSIVALTNNHVVGMVHKNGWPMITYTISGITFDSYTEAGIINEPMAQPSYADYPNFWNGMLKVKKIEGFKVNNNISNPQYIDAAVLKFDSINKSNFSVLELTNNLGTVVSGGPFPWASPGEVTVGMQLFKSGRTTGMVNFGTITSIDASPVVTLQSGYSTTYDEQIETYYPTRCAYSGDSGSGVYATIGGYTKLVGLLHAANTPAGTFYYTCPIWKVADALNVKAWNGDIILSSSNGNSFSKNGVTYNLYKGTSIAPTHTA